ncbi:hypothetical protein BH23ACT11_BH23ACT11_04070 [soil metagenome]
MSTSNSWKSSRLTTMSALSIRLLESLHKQVKELSECKGISINQFIAVAVAEKMSALMTVEYLE